jgi:branched-chain amino acid transport system permease protein
MVTALAGVLFDGFAYGMLLFLMSVGLSVTLGLMNFTNLAHGSFAMLGGYVVVGLIERAGWPFLATLPAAFLVTAAVSVVFERLLFCRFYRRSELDQVLVTIGLVFVSTAAAAYLFGTLQRPVQIPTFLRGAWNVEGVSIGVYRTFLIAIAVVIAVVLVIGLEKTRLGAQIRAAVDNQRMARGLGIDVDRAFALTFAVGSGLAGLGGGLAVEWVGLDPGFGLRFLVYVLIVVSMGGLGSVAGSFGAAVLIGIADMACKYYVPELGAFLIYALMVLLLFIRPQGLFGRR